MAPLDERRLNTAEVASILGTDPLSLDASPRDVKMTTPTLLSNSGWDTGHDPNGSCPVCAHSWGAHHMYVEFENPMGGRLQCPEPDCDCTSTWGQSTWGQEG